jgi:5-keto 4-deoxyuronate isomerase
MLYTHVVRYVIGSFMSARVLALMNKHNGIVLKIWLFMRKRHIT